ncbi:MAG: D-glycero-beta-D-manno-heptose 1-phosphate adenylyltransferase [Candidatus Brocadiales bacterium]
MHSKLVEILTNIDKPNILVIGDLMLDKYVWGEVKRISPEAPIPILSVTSEDSRPGGAGCVINNLCYLGARVYCVGTIGADDEGHQLLNQISKLGAETSGILEDAERPTTVKVRMMGHLQTASRGIQQLIRVDYEKTHPISINVEKKIIQHLEERISHTNVVLVSDMNKGLLSEKILKAIVRLGKKHSIPVIVDPKLSDSYSCYAGVTVITPNRYETKFSTGIALVGQESLKTAGKKLVNELGLECAIITIDKDGIFLYRNDENCRLIPTVPKEVSDVTGAGDVILSVLGFVTAGGYSLEDAAAIANVAAGIEVGKIGAIPVSISEILKELTDREQPFAHKILDAHELTEHLNQCRMSRQKIVFTNGCFDILHVGHIEYLKFSRRQGDVLVVGLNTDRSVREQKGSNRPVVPQHERAQLLAALEDIDYVILFDEPTPDELIKKVKPDVLVKGEDWQDKGVVGSEFVQSYGGKVVLAPLVEGVSTSNILSRIVNSQLNPTI